ncbi:MAG: hypothetical protein RL594_457 [Bacteroidota bacterium]|jgi:hypothetical protein
MKSLVVSSAMAVLLALCACAQEVDLDTLREVSTQSLIDEIITQAAPGTRLSLRFGDAGQLANLRVSIEHPRYRLGLLHQPMQDLPTLGWAIVGGRTWMLAAGDCIVEPSLGTLLSVSNGMGRSALMPNHVSDVMNNHGELASSFRGGRGGIRGLLTRAAATSRDVVTLVAGNTVDDYQRGCALIGIDSQRWGASSAAYLLARRTNDNRILLAASVSTAAGYKGLRMAAEVVSDHRGRPAVQAVMRHDLAPTTVSVACWWAHPQCELPLGSLLAASGAVANSWGGNIRIRHRIVDLATFSLSVTLMGHPWRTHRLPMASTSFDLIGDVQQRITDRLRIEWRVRVRHDEEGRTLQLREQHERLRWTLRCRVERRIHSALDVRMNADVQIGRSGLAPFVSAALVWVEPRWNMRERFTLRGRLSVYASPEFDIAPRFVEYASTGLQTMVVANGYGRRASLSVEWEAGDHAVLALQTGIESRVSSGVYVTSSELRATLGIRLNRERTTNAVLPVGDTPQLHGENAER